MLCLKSEKDIREVVKRTKVKEALIRKICLLDISGFRSSTGTSYWKVKSRGSGQPEGRRLRARRGRAGASATSATSAGGSHAAPRTVRVRVASGQQPCRNNFFFVPIYQYFEYRYTGTYFYCADISHTLISKNPAKFDTRSSGNSLGFPAIPAKFR